MSKDWTPQQLRWVDKESHLSKNTIYWVNPQTNEQTAIVDSDSEEAKAYPHLYFLYGDTLRKRMLSAMSKDSIARVEKILHRIIEVEDANNAGISKIADANTLFDENVELVKLTISWYEGKLDEGFYYREENDRLFFEGLSHFFREQDDTNVSKSAMYVLAIANNLGLNAQDLLSEAECVEEYGEWLHMELLGYNADALREAAAQMTITVVA